MLPTDEGIRPRTPRSKTPTTPRQTESAFQGALIRVPARRAQGVNPVYDQGVNSLTNQSVTNLVRTGSTNNFKPIDLASDSKLATEFYNFYNKPQPEPSGYMGAHYNPRTATVDDLNNWLTNVKNQTLDRNRSLGIYSIYQTIMNKSPAIPAQPFVRVNERYSDDDGRNSRQGFLDLLEDTSTLPLVPTRQQATTIKSGIAELLTQIGIHRTKLLPSIFTIDDTRFISNTILNNNRSEIKKQLIDCICDADTFDTDLLKPNIKTTMEMNDKKTIRLPVLNPLTVQGSNPISLKDDIVDAVNLYDSDRNAPSVNQIPIFIVLEIGSGFHTAVLLKINEQIYSFGYGYSTLNEVNKNPVSMAVIETFDMHTGNGGLYSPDHLIDYNDPSNRNRIIDIGILKPYHLTKIQEYLSYVEEIISEFGLINNDNDIELTYNILSGSRVPEYSTISSKIGSTLTSVVGNKQKLNCASFISSIFPSVKTGMFVSMPNSAIGRADDEKIEHFQRLYLENDVDGIKELLCDECCGIDCSKCGEPISEAYGTCKQCCYSKGIDTLKDIERSNIPILKKTGLSCLAGKCRNFLEPSDTQEMREPLIHEMRGQQMERGGKFKTKRRRYNFKKTRKLRNPRKPRKSRKLRNKNTRKYI